MDELTRRRLLALGVSLPLASALGACGAEEGARGAAAEGVAAEGAAGRAGLRLAPTPQCDDGDDDPTPEQTEGPYFTPDSPRRRDLVEDGIQGRLLVVSGTVVDTECRPVRRALLDFWQADDDGVYDNEGYRLRGHQLTDARGRFRLRTIVPGLYPGRTRHLHVKVQRPGGAVLTTQLYFPGEASNRSDGIFDAALLMALRKGERWRGRFAFVLA